MNWFKKLILKRKLNRLLILWREYAKYSSFPDALKKMDEVYEKIIIIEKKLQ